VGSIGRFRHRVTIQVKKTVPGPTGPTITWEDVESRKANVVLLGLEARAQYQQLNSNVQRRIDFQGEVFVDYANHRFLWRDKVLYPVEPAGEYSGIGKRTSIAVTERGPVS